MDKLKNYCLLFVYFLVLFIHVKSESIEEKPEGKVLSIFNVVTFPNDICNGGSRNGTCYTEAECTSRGGTNSGSCASGYGVCCVFTLSCGGSSSDNCTYIEQSSFTTGDTNTPSPCCYTICPCNTNICRIRLDFTTFQIAGPVSGTALAAAAATPASGGALGDCNQDAFTFSSEGGTSSPTICGFNDGQHMIIDAGTGCSMACFSFTSSTAKSWTMKATQYNCGETDTAGGPPGCLQYYTATSGTIANFNYPTETTNAISATAQHLSDQDYKICFRRQSGMCRICFSPLGDADNAFGVSVSIDAAAKSGTDTDCTTDYLGIPNGVANTEMSATVEGENRFCGRFLNIARNLAATTTVCTLQVPFMVQVKFDSDEATTAMAATTNELILMPAGTLGFQLGFVQMTCT